MSSILKNLLTIRQKSDQPDLMILIQMKAFSGEPVRCITCSLLFSQSFGADENFQSHRNCSVLECFLLSSLVILFFHGLIYSRIQLFGGFMKLKAISKLKVFLLQLLNR